VRRAVALGVLVVAVLVIALGVHSCQVSARNSALQDYTNNVSSLITQSNQTGTALFQALTSGGSSGNGINAQNSINATLRSADKVLNAAKRLDVPDEVKVANSDLVRVLQMRADGISNIASEIQPALGTSASASYINKIAAEMERLYASDVVYKDYAVPETYGALHAAGTRFSGLPAGQFVSDVEWVIPSHIASELHVSVPGIAPAKVAPGLHGHSLDSVSVSGITLQTGSNNAIPAKPVPTFTLHFTNGGTNNETGVVCKVSVTGSTATGQTVVPETFAGKSSTCQVTLKTSPPAGTQSVVATIAKVAGEKNTSNNSQSFPVTFQ
jgi:hypothetical protein